MLKDSVFTFISRLILVGLTALNVLILARFLGPKGQGVFTVIATFVTLLASIGTLGIGQANVYFIGQKRYTLKELFWNSMLVSLIMGFLLIGIALFLYDIFPPAFKGADKELVLLYAWSIPLLLGWGNTNSLILGLLKFTAFNIISMIIGGLSAIGYIVFLSSSPDTKTAIIIAVIINVIGFILPIAYLAKEGGLGMLKPKCNITALVDCLKFGIKGHLGSVVDFMNFRTDRFLVNWFVGPAAVSFYSIAVTVGESIWHVSRSIAMVLFPKVSTSGDILSNAQTTAKSCRISFLSSFLIGIFLLVTGRWLIPLVFGAAFIESVPALNFLLPGIIIFSLTNIIASYLVGEGFPHYSTIIALISFVFNVAINLWLIPIIGIVGASIASTISYTISTLFSIYLYKKIVSRKSLEAKREINVSLSDIMLIKQNDWKSIRNIFRQFYI